MRWFIASAVIFFALSSSRYFKNFIDSVIIIFHILGDALECYTCSSHIGIPNSMNDCERFDYYENHRKSVCMPGDQVCAKYIVNRK